MLAAPAVKPFLVHEDRAVRDAAVGYFKDSWSQDPDLVPMILRAYRQYGEEEGLHGVVCCRQLMLTPQSLDEVLDCLAATESPNIIFHLNCAVARAPVDVLLAKEAAILDARHVRRETVDTVKQRLELSQWSPGKLWAELQDYARLSEDKQYASEIDHNYANNLIAALATYDEPDNSTICDLLAAEKTEFRSIWRANDESRKQFLCWSIDIGSIRRCRSRKGCRRCDPWWN